MKKIPYHIVDAFTDKVFGGNPAGVCLLDNWLPDELMQNIAAENNLSETAFLVKQGDHYGLRWFTPTLEIDLCGHATLASAFVLFDEVESKRDELSFEAMSGTLSVTKSNGMLYLDFPALAVSKCPDYPTLKKALGTCPVVTYKGDDFLVLLDSEETLKSVQPNFSLLKKVAAKAGVDPNTFIGVIITAPASKERDCDFVSRYFAPSAGIDEDPVTGRAHCSLIPFWSQRLGKQKLQAQQLSRRGGTLICEYLGERVKIGGEAVRYLKGEIYLP